MSHQYNQSDTVTGGHLYSIDGFNWTSSTEAVYDVMMDFGNGTTNLNQARRPPGAADVTDQQRGAAGVAGNGGRGREQMGELPGLLLRDSTDANSVAIDRRRAKFT